MLPTAALLCTKKDGVTIDVKRAQETAADERSCAEESASGSPRGPGSAAARGFVRDRGDGREPDPPVVDPGDDVPIR